GFAEGRPHRDHRRAVRQRSARRGVRGPGGLVRNIVEGLPARYELDAKPAKSGQQGAVYFGRDLVLQREIAVKVVPSADDARREAEALASVAGHGSMLAVFDLFEVDGAGYIVTERVRGKPLGSDESGHRRSETNAVRLTMDVLRALRHMHQ